MPWTPAGSNRFYRLLVGAGLFLRWLFGIRLMVTGQENLPEGKAGAVVAITHFGYLDFAAAELVFWAHNRGQLRFMIHQGAADHWLAGPFISATGQVVVPYGSGTAAYDDAVARLRAGDYLAVLPEAGVSRSFKVRECKTGAVRMAAEAGVPLIPVSVWGAHRILTRGNGLPLHRVGRAPVRVHIGEPVHLAAGIDAEAETARLRRTLQAGIDAAIASFPVAAQPGDWWMPADLGGGAISGAERQRLDAADLARDRRRSSRTTAAPEVNPPD
ncbi:1-acyl-sn-glycerol-3-phosphate acyltransferase [Arthrobacter sp. FW305-BF8]|uniref:lysophospholipid acyltransferase family protein n=1 Tax=Arthrobacter sp. FW305-BF8 TaxID=2879617 RepID=UPI001F24750D|nr:lysophospholipid acyltransferase family protein [Arthrobacter sp. FW305-BF8]UKA55804.1 1-acyl-sn-glycerol-3-phosphate acyltransferase [Arthrobacter sp. FW305-BF8]